MVKRLMELVKSKLDKGGVAHVNYTAYELNDGNQFLFFNSGEDGWTVYQGCELVVGDTTLEYCCQCVLDVVELGHR